MEENTITQLEEISQRLHSRALALSDTDQPEDTATLMSALAVTMEAVRSLGVTLNQMNEIPGLGRSGV